MSVAQLPEHIPHNLKELVGREPVCHLPAVSHMHLVPVDTQLPLFLLKETLSLVHDTPQGFQIALSGVCILIL